ncbi:MULTISPECIES: MucR family transcriptional regulator [Sphingobium]|jgi:predicted transcriptional regulator|uniref:MucR family transcriptional regulator n=3 Tax=Sphingobium TaxID=165695 RepID=A0A6P1GE13_SPHYA|nr:MULTISPECIES: MucR family transcriptional regulator [Sphingobium]EQB16811.1 hypothetical protein RLDS_06750 [Sphingobium lactosutens DS20]QDC36651.1 MucR family transcriptional regulator [Sphingobium fuliginis ATCC 27551]QHD66746.1 MucR family transcriptional regulator [Sphingobium yanoikuyae]QNG43865.1 MucR family transcriptional regulator [Sphingobium yanoikuyae]
MAETDNAGVMSLTVTLLSAYFANNTVPSGELPSLVEGTRRALLGDAPVGEGISVKPADDGVAETPPAPRDYKAAVSVEESLASPDQIVSLIDGKPYKALKRHLSTHGLTPAEYRSRYDLPADYPMVAPSYSAARREVARKLGLGGKRKSAPAPVAEAAAAPPAVEAPETAAAEATQATSAPARRGRVKAVEAEPKPAAKRPRRKAKDGAAKTPASNADAAPKPKRSRVRKVAGEAAAPSETAPEIPAVAQ